MRAVLAVLLALTLTSGVTAQNAVSAKEAYTRAVALEASGNQAAALALLWQAAGAAPRDGEIQNRLGEALARLGALDAAVEAFAQARRVRPNLTKAADNLVLTLAQAGRGAEAVQQAQRFIAEAPDDPDRVFTLGLALAEQDIEEAIRTFRRVLDRTPSHTRARYNLALVYQRADRLADAATELQRTIDTEPRAEAYYSLGIVRWHQGDLDRASQGLQAAVEANPAYASAHEALGGVLRDRKDWAGAASAFRRAIALRPEQPAAYIALARVLQSSGQEAEAREALAQGEQRRRRTQLEHEALVWTAVGIRKLDGDDVVGALDAFRRATGIVESYAPAHYQIGRALQRLGQPEAARAAFARAQQLNPSLVPPTVSR
ncbi:MAG: tetratricopeptide repeat protein [Vicinamibacterales bacterium]